MLDCGAGSHGYSVPEAAVVFSGCLRVGGGYLKCQDKQFRPDNNVFTRIACATLQCHQLQMHSIKPERLNEVRRRRRARTGVGLPRQRHRGAGDVGHLRFGWSSRNQIRICRVAGMNDNSKLCRKKEPTPS